MIRQADLLAYCRAGLDTEQIIAVLSAITSRMSANDPACIALDKANDSLMDLQESARISELWEQDDAACKRGNAAGSLPAFIRQGATA